MSFVYWTANRRWFLLRDGYRRKVCRISSKYYYVLYDVSRPVTNADYPVLEKVSESAIKEKQKFERLVVPKKTLLEMFEASHDLSTSF
jgi:threonyl-tRNA synthetase